MRTYQRITLFGFDGHEAQSPEIEDIWKIVLAQAKEQFGDAFDINQITRRYAYGEERAPQSRWCLDRVQAHLCGYFVVKEHNSLVSDLNRLETLVRDSVTAITAADQAYADLSKNTTINWLAAHHRYVLAARHTRDLLTERLELATRLAGAGDNLHLFREPGRIVYTENVPEANRIQLPGTGTAQAALDNFVATTTERFQILRATITGAMPPGFAPAVPDITEEWAGANVPISPALALADHAMAIPGPRAGDQTAHVRNW